MVWCANRVRKELEKQMPCDSSKSDYYQFGWQKFGPFLYGYVRWLYNNIKRNPVKKVFFFSRDGYMMMRAFQMINAENFELEYVYFSRKSISQTLLWRCSTYEESLKYLTWERFVSVGKLLEYYGFDEDERKNIARQFNLDISQDYKYDLLQSSKELKELYLNLKPVIDEKSCKQDELLLAYLKQIDLLGECAIVDIGWHGSMQYFLEQFMQQHDLNVMIHGYYIGISPSNELKGSVYGFLYDKNEQTLRKSLLCFLGGYERLFQSMEGSTYGYREQENKIVPELNRYEYEGQDKVFYSITEWQEGALDFVRKATEIDLKMKDKELAMPLVKLGRNPSMKEVRLFSLFYNTDGIESYYVSSKRLFQYKPRELVHAFSNSVWKTGFMKSAFKLPLPYFLIYCLMKK